MAVEIFSATPSTGGTARAYGAEISITAPSDIYFGKGAPGIAYFEKAGADLRVTLLDGQQVLLRDFFVIGPDGDASRLLDGVGGPVEVTGLLAPEPFQPETGTIHPVEVDQVDTGHADAGAVVTAPETGAAAPVQAEAAPAEASDASDGTGGWTLGGVGLDRLAFSTALGAILGEIIVSDNGSDHASDADAALPPDEPAADAVDTTSPTDAATADEGASPSETSADPAALVADLIGSEFPSLDIAALMAFGSGAEATDSSGADAAAPDSGLAGGMFDSAAETSGAEADSAAIAASLPDSDTTLAALMQGSEDVHGA